MWGKTTTSNNIKHTDLDYNMQTSSAEGPAPRDRRRGTRRPISLNCFRCAMRSQAVASSVTECPASADDDSLIASSSAANRAIRVQA